MNLSSIGSNILLEEDIKQAAASQTGTVDVLNPNAQLTFNGDTLTWFADGKPIKEWKAISGLTIKNSLPSEWGKMLRRYSMNPREWSKDKNAGPTPPGKYVLGDLQTRSGDHSKVMSQLRSIWTVIKDGSRGKWTKGSDAFHLDNTYSRISWGNFRAPILATKGTETFGRGSFYLHGGTVPGSHGCIDLTSGMDDFGKFYGTWLASTGKKSIPFTVDYGEERNHFFGRLWREMTRKLRGSSPEKEGKREARRQARQARRLTKQPAPATPQVTAPTGILRMGARGEPVKALQTQLKNVNFDPGVIDGIFGKNTARALIQFQNANGLKADGIFGPNTSRKLFSV